MTRIEQGWRLARSADPRQVKRGERILREQGIPVALICMDEAMQRLARNLACQLNGLGPAMREAAATLGRAVARINASSFDGR